MAARTAGKRGNGEGGIYRRESDGRWVASVDLGYINGKRRRKVIYGATRREVAEKLRRALETKSSGMLVSRTSTLVEWYATYLEQVARAKVRPSTFISYERDFRLHVAPTLGKIRLDKLEPAHLAGLYQAKLKEGLSPTTVRLLHATVRRALAVALKWGLVSRNVATLVDPPGRVHHEVQPLTPEEARGVLSAAKGDPLEARWVVGLSLGLRQGEALGLWWEDVDLDDEVLRVSRQLTRARHGGGLMFAPLKSLRSRRTLSLPRPLAESLRQHRTRQAAERLAVGGRWRDNGLIFATPLGTPIDPRNDTRAFKALLARAGVRDTRLHDLRHTAASLLLAQGMHPRVVMEVLGHSQIALTMNTYSHVMPSLLQEAAASIEKALWGVEIVR